MEIDPYQSEFYYGITKLCTQLFDPKVKNAIVGSLIDPICGGCPISTAHCYSSEVKDSSADRVIEDYLHLLFEDFLEVRKFEVHPKNKETKQLYIIDKDQLKLAILQRILSLRVDNSKVYMEDLPIKIVTVNGKEFKIMDTNYILKNMPHMTFLNVLDPLEIARQFISAPSELLEKPGVHIIARINSILESEH